MGSVTELIHVSVLDWGRGGAEEDLLCTIVSHDLHRRGQESRHTWMTTLEVVPRTMESSINNTFFPWTHSYTMTSVHETYVNGHVLQLDGALSHALTGHDEGTGDVSVLVDGLGERLVEGLGDLVPRGSPQAHT